MNFLGGNNLGLSHDRRLHEPVTKKTVNYPTFQTRPVFSNDTEIMGLSGDFNIFSTPGPSLSIKSVPSINLNLLEHGPSVSIESKDPVELLTLAYNHIHKIKQKQHQEAAHPMVEESLKAIEKMYTILNDPEHNYKTKYNFFSPLVVEQVMRSINNNNLFPGVFKMSLDLLSVPQLRTIGNFLKKMIASIALDHKEETKGNMEELFDYLKQTRNGMLGNHVPNLSDAMTLKYLQDIKTRKRL